MSRLFRLLRRSAVFAATLATLVVVPSGAASAHAFLVASVPADGSELTSAPTQLLLRFSESIEAGATRLDLVGTNGHVWQPTSLQVVSAQGGRTAGDRPTLVLVGLPVLPPDAYRVQWNTLSSDDLHQTSGLIVFGVQRAVSAAGLHETPPALPESGLRWLLFVAVAVALGGPLLAGLYRPGG